MSNRGRAGSVIALAVLLTGGAALAAEPDGAVLDQAPSDFPVQYMVKFVCGLAPVQPTGEEPPVKPGNYATAINLYNHLLVPVVGSRRVALHYRADSPPPPVIPPKRTALVRLRVLEIDCTDIWRMSNLPPGIFVKGMVHIGLPVRLPVVAVYTSQTNLGPGTALDPGAGISIDVEEVHPFIEIPQ